MPGSSTQTKKVPGPRAVRCGRVVVAAACGDLDRRHRADRERLLRHAAEPLRQLRRDALVQRDVGIDDLSRGLERPKARLLGVPAQELGRGVVGPGLELHLRADLRDLAADARHFLQAERMDGVRRQIAGRVHAHQVPVVGRAVRQRRHARARATRRQVLGLQEAEQRRHRRLHLIAERAFIGLREAHALDRVEARRHDLQCGREIGLVEVGLGEFREHRQRALDQRTGNRIAAAHALTHVRDRLLVPARQAQQPLQIVVIVGHSLQRLQLLAAAEHREQHRHAAVLIDRHQVGGKRIAIDRELHLAEQQLAGQPIVPAERRLVDRTELALHALVQRARARDLGRRNRDRQPAFIARGGERGRRVQGIELHLVGEIARGDVGQRTARVGLRDGLGRQHQAEHRGEQRGDQQESFVHGKPRSEETGLAL